MAADGLLNSLRRSISRASPPLGACDLEEEVKEVEEKVEEKDAPNWLRAYLLSSRLFFTARLVHQRLQFTLLVHLSDDVTTANQLAVDEKLGKSWPV